MNRVTSYTYEGGRLTSVARPDHDGNGQLTVTTMAYTSAGLLASITDPLGRATGYGYDSQSRRTSVTLPDPDGAGEQSAPVTQYSYDALGRVISTSDAQNNVTTYVYSNHGRTVTVTEPDPDGAGELSAPVTVLQYDSAGNLLSQTDALGRVTSYGYDALGRQETITEPDPDGEGPLAASVTTYAYDKAGNLTSVTDPLDQVTEYVYDARNRRTQIIDAEDGVTQFAYDAVGNLLGLTDPVDNTTTWEYDGLNRVIAETNELDFTRTFRYDSAGRQTQRVDRLGRVIVYAYDPLDNLTTETWYANQADADAQANPVNVIHYTYDAAGRLLSEWDTYSSSTYTYDSLDRVLTETIANPGSPTVVLTTGYDDSPSLPAGDGQGVTALRTSLSATIAGAADFLRIFEYDSRGQLTGITQTGQTGGNVVANLQIDLAYDSLGRFASITRYQDSHLVATSTWQYDAAYHLTALTHAQGATTLAGYTWTYDSAGRLTQMTSPDGTVVYSYDSTSQLTGADYSPLPPGEGQGEGVQDDETFDWDANGNPTGTGYVVGPNNQLLSDGTYRYQYDAEGNRSAKYVWTDANTDGVVDSGERSQITEYSWDHRNRLTGVTFKNAQEQVTKAVDYVYDTSNRRIAKEVDDDGDGQTDRGQRWVYDSESAPTSSADGGATAGLKVSHVLFEFDLDGDLTRRNLHGPVVDQILAEEDLASDPGNVEVLWPLAGHLGTVRDVAVYDPVADETAVANHIVYSSFGEIVSQSSPAVAVRFSYTGREWDTDLALYYYRARWYDAHTGRFLGEDPIQFCSDETQLCRFCSNDTTRLTDPVGLVGDGHHIVPQCLWEGLSEAARKFFDSDAARLFHDAYTQHNGKVLNGVGHPTYTNAVREELEAFFRRKDLSKLTEKDARAFLAHLKSMPRNSVIAKYLAGVRNEIRAAVQAAKAAKNAGKAAKAVARP